MVKLLQVCVVGDAARPEFQYALSNVSSSAYVCYVSSTSDLFRLNPSPDAIILLQSYPGEYCSEDVDKIIQNNPIASLILITSSWCEGERRTGTPIRDAIRVPWYDFRFWFDRQKTLFNAGRLSQLSLPHSASDAQRAELDSQNKFPARTDDVFWIFSDSAVQRETMSRFYDSLGAKVWSGGMTAAFPDDSQLARPTRIVVFPDFLSDSVFERVSELKTLNPNAALYVVVYQPRIEEIESLRQNGADEILSPEFYQYAAL